MWTEITFVSVGDRDHFFKFNTYYNSRIHQPFHKMEQFYIFCLVFQSVIATPDHFNIGGFFITSSPETVKYASAM